MKIQTLQFGEIKFDADMIIRFDEGLIGFGELKKYLLLKEDDNLFYWLNSVENPEIAFPLIGMRILDENYPKAENCEAFGIVTLNKDPLKVTVNLKAPVYLDQENKTGFQKIVDTDKYPVCYNLFVK